MGDLSKNIKKVLIVYLMLFICLISYFTYFVVAKGPGIAKSTYNKRLWAKRNEVLRGTIYDRKMNALTKSKKISTLNQKREYTGGAVFAHALGYVDPVYGITGLENKYDSQLMADNSLNFVQLWKNKGKNRKKVGNSLKTTLDSKIQKTAYNLLGNRKGAVVVLNPSTGEILAMVSKPSFNPNDLKKTWKSINTNPHRPLLNRAVSGLYPPGSSFKIITTASSLENISGIEQRTINDTGKLVLNRKYSLRNFGGHAYGVLNIDRAFTKSSNVFFGQMALELGNDKLRATAEKFMFNKDITGNGIVIDKSRFPELKSYEKGNIAQSGIGQASVLATPMEMAMVTSAIANEGVMMQPRIVDQILTYDGKPLSSVENKELTTAVSTDIADKIKGYMRNVVTSGTGRAAAVQGIEVAGKTGTADHGKKGTTPHSWFVGFAPYNKPTVALAVLVEDGGQGGIAAAQVASGVFKAALK
ncbi:peptidoglycan D,D-transpeptidase FtsI family protein [Clostridium oryzae]|uniref:Penicillin-binding protein A n=1 Tax=Clostridium oryzae TaxID=1450648 RepID=A0A1V4IZA9_9CLOT|nr:penicillin-binding transpeptidase domain-containing protein [Clostridium oryzae]OPJ65114.1 penicillin-binding protein A [Clostridium oryzae]